MGTNWGLRALLSYYDATGEAYVLEAARRTLLWFVKNWDGHYTHYVGSTIIESMISVYVLTGDKCLYDWSLNYINWLNRFSKWPYGVNDFLSDTMHYNSSHVVAYGENVKHPAIMYCADGNAEFLRASVKGLQKIMDKCGQRTGAPSSNMEYISPPGATAETEFCNFSTFSHTFSWMAMATGDPRYGDMMEKIIYNGAQGARKNDERAVSYMSAPNTIVADRHSCNFFVDDMLSYAPCYHTACCPTQSVRAFPELIRGMCMADAEGNLYFVAYGPCAVKTDGMEIVCETHYPFNETLKFTVRADSPCNKSIHFKIPEWCESAEMEINGAEREIISQKGGFRSVFRDWMGETTITLAFRSGVRVVKINDNDLANKQPIAFEYGPLLFCLPIAERWEPYPGSPMTPLPENWSWYEVKPEIRDIETDIYNLTCSRFEYIPWHVAVREDVDVSEIKIIRAEPDGYVWENPPIRLSVPMRRAKYAYFASIWRTTEVYEAPVASSPEEITVELIPYGCTALRISYFPRASLHSE